MAIVDRKWSSLPVPNVMEYTDRFIGSAAVTSKTRPVGPRGARSGDPAVEHHHG